MKPQMVDIVGFGLAPLRNEGAVVEYDRGARKPTEAEIAVARAEQAAREAKWTDFAKRMATELNGGEYGWYEAPYCAFVEDIMKIEAALREEIAAATPEHQ